MKVWMNGTLVDESQATVSVLDHGLLYGDGVFEGIRVYGGKIFQCDAHIDRLFASGKFIRLAIPFTRQELVDGMYATLHANGRTDAYIRLVVTRGPGNLGLSPFTCSRPNTIIIADTIALYPQEMYRDGMEVIIAKTVRTSPRMVPPRAKTLNYLNNILAKIEAIDAGTAEAIMLNEHGEVSECTGDNIFIIEKGRLITPPDEAGILCGITRGAVIEMAQGMGIPVAKESILPARLYAADECFLTGSAAEIIPVTKIDAHLIGTGKVGAMTMKLHEAFHAMIKGH